MILTTPLTKFLKNVTHGTVRTEFFVAQNFAERNINEDVAKFFFGGFATLTDYV